MKNTLKHDIVYIGNRLSAHGYTPTSIEALGPALEQIGYTIHYASSKLSKILRLADMLGTIYRHRSQCRVVLIDTYSTGAFYFAWLCAALCRMLSLRYIPILHGGNLPYRLNASPGLSKQLFERAYMNIAVSGYLASYFQAAGFRCQIIPNSIDIQQYLFKRRTTLLPRLLWVRSFDDIYNPAMAVLVLKEILNKYPHASLTMVGPDKDGSMRQCKQLAASLGLASQVSFTGKLTKSDWTSLAAQQDIFINTSRFDNLPVSVIEAMALGLPVVSTNVGGIPFLIENGTTGQLVAEGDVTAMSKAVEDLVEHSAMAGSMALAARAKAENYDWLQVGKAWHALLNNINDGD